MSTETCFSYRVSARIGFLAVPPSGFLQPLTCGPFLHPQSTLLPLPHLLWLLLSCPSLIWPHLDNPRRSPPLKVLTLITSAKSSFPHKEMYSSVLKHRMWTSWRDCYSVYHASLKHPSWWLGTHLFLNLSIIWLSFVNLVTGRVVEEARPSHCSSSLVRWKKPAGSRTQAALGILARVLVIPLGLDRQVSKGAVLG